MKKYIINKDSIQLINWGRYNLYKFQGQFFITKKSYMCQNTQKELIVSIIPKYLLYEVINKKHIDSRYIRKIQTMIKFYENDKRKTIQPEDCNT